VVVRNDLHQNYQSVQAGHAAIQFQHEYQDIAKEWHEKSKYLIYLSVPDEQHIKDLITKSEFKFINISIFREPDIDNEITAIAFEPSKESARLLSNLPLAKIN